MLRTDPLGIVGLLALLAVWWLIAGLQLVPAIFLPPPDEVARTIARNFFYAGLAVMAAVTGFRTSRRSLGAIAPAWSAAAMAGAAGMLYGLGAVAEKAVASNVVGQGIAAGVISSLVSAYPWLFLLVTLAGMVVCQVALQQHAASLVATVSNVVSSICALAGASMVFGELLLPHGWWSVARFAGFAGVVAALMLLAWVPDESRVEAAIP